MTVNRCRASPLKTRTGGGGRPRRRQQAERAFQAEISPTPQRRQDILQTPSMAASAGSAAEFKIRTAPPVMQAG